MESELVSKGYDSGLESANLPCSTGCFSSDSELAAFPVVTLNDTFKFPSLTSIDEEGIEIERMINEEHDKPSLSGLQPSSFGSHDLQPIDANEDQGIDFKRFKKSFVKTICGC